MNNINLQYHDELLKLVACFSILQLMLQSYIYQDGVWVLKHRQNFQKKELTLLKLVVAVKSTSSVTYHLYQTKMKLELPTTGMKMNSIATLKTLLHVLVRIYISIKLTSLQDTAVA